MQENATPRRVLALSSQVAFGHVGLTAAVPVLQRLGHRVTPLPTVMLSNHPGWAHVAGRPVTAQDLRTMIDALDQNGWLARHDTILTGYLPSADHVDLAAELIVRMRDLRPDRRVIVDPILGDAPKGLYIAEEAATALRDRLIPLADVITPNRFALGWLTGLAVDCEGSIVDAARRLPAKVLATSAPFGPERTGCLEVTGTSVRAFSVPLQSGVPHGVGDVFSALVAGQCLTGQALGHLQALISLSLGHDHLRIVETADSWTSAPSIGPMWSRMR